MPGITAFLQFGDSSGSSSELLSRALSASYSLPELKTHSVRLASGIIALGGTFPKHFHRSVPMASRDGKTLLFYGELYNNLGRQTEAEYALEIILRNGYDSIGDLNGPFVAFVSDELKEELVILTDRLGRFPVFYQATNGRAFFTTDLHSLFSAGIVVPDLDEESVVDLLTIGFSLGENSVFTGIKRITGGEVWRMSRAGLTRHRYWEPRYTNTLHDVKPMIETFDLCVRRAMQRSSKCGVTLSGGWDSRATCSVASTLGIPFTGTTFGVTGSTDVSIASSVAQALHIQHTILEPTPDFFHSFREWAEKVVILSNGHATIDLAFQIFMYERMREHFPSVIDSAGCEFRRGIRAQQTAQTARQTEDVTRFLTSMYATGVWNKSTIGEDFYRKHASTTERKLTQWLDSLGLKSYEDQIDAFSSEELWAHHYAHGYPLQTNIIACQMPFSDNEFYDLFLHSSHEIRWSHAFHQAVIRRFAPQLERIPISHGHVKVPYGESITRYLPVLYHRILSRASSVDQFGWLRALDNYRPFRPYLRWYSHELDAYVQEMLHASSLASSGYVDVNGLRHLLNLQKTKNQDLTHPISIVLTLAHLLEYVQSFRRRTKMDS